MAASLPPDAIAQYHRDGFLAPVRVFGEDEARDYRCHALLSQGLDPAILAARYPALA